MEIDGVIEKFGVTKVNECGERMIEMCCELGLLIGNTCLKKRRLHKYTYEDVREGRVVEMALMDYIVV